MIATLHDGLVLLHVACGAFALVALWVPLLSKKGGKLHVRVGKAYAAAMAIVVVTALAASALAFANPLGIEPGVAARLDADGRAAYVERRRPASGSSRSARPGARGC